MSTQDGVCEGDQIFSGIKYYVTGDIRDEIYGLLRDGGGQQMNYFSDYVTHCIVGENAAENDIADANELYEIPAVRMEWIVLCSKCKKLLPTKGFLAGHTQIFSGVVACVSQLSKSDAKRVWVMITFNGGRVESFLQPLSTHLIVSRPEGTKYEHVVKSGSPVEAVTPDWVVDCVREGMRCEEAHYHPRLLLLPNTHVGELPSPTAGTAAAVRKNGATLSTAQILGFTDDAIESSLPPAAPTSKASILEQLKQRMPWNQPTFSQSKTVPPSAAVPTPPFQQQQSFHHQAQQMIIPQQQQQQQQQQVPTLPRALPATAGPVNSSVVPASLQELQQEILPGQLGVVPVAQGQHQKFRPVPVVQQQQRVIHHVRGPAWRPAMLSTPHQQQVPLQIQQVPVQKQQFVFRGEPGAPLQAPQKEVPTVTQGWSSQQQYQLQSSRQIIDEHAPQSPWPQRLSAPGMPRQFVVDSQTHAQIQQMDSQQRAMFLHKMQKQGQLLFQRQLQAQQMIQQQQHQRQQQQRQQQQQQQQVLLRGQVPPGLTPQQLQWVSQLRDRQSVISRQQQVLVPQQVGLPNSVNTGSGATTTTSTWIPVQGETAAGDVQLGSRQQQQQHLVQLHLQRQQQLRLQQQQLQQQQQAQLQQQQQQQQQAQQQQQQLHLPCEVPPATPKPLAQQTQQQQQLLHGQLAQLPHQPPPTPQPQHHLDTLISAGQQQFQVQTGEPHLAPQQQPPPPLHMPQPPQMSRPHPHHQARTLPTVPLHQELQQQVGELSRDQFRHQEGSAAGQLRLMTAQHNASQHQPPPCVLPTARPVRPVISEQQQQQQQFSFQQQQQQQQQQIHQQYRHALPAEGAAPVRAGSQPVPALVPQSAPNVVRTVQPQTAATAVRVVAALAKSAQSMQSASSGQHPGRPQQHFYGHTPGLKLPPDRCLLGCVFFIVDYNNMASAWKKVISEYGGEVEVSYVPRITHVVCETLKHPAAQQAFQDGKRCVTAYWLNDVIGRKHVVPPWQAIHFPTNFSDGKPCRNLIISLTQFEDDERRRVRFLIEELGAKYTGYFSKENNILVCKRDEGDKCKKARLWKIPLVNVQWLGDVYLGNGSIKSPDAPKYQQFESILGNPFSVDYAALIHLMTPWKEPLQIPPHLFSSKLSSPSQRPVKRSQNTDNVEDETAPQLPGKMFKLSDKKDSSDKYRITFSYIRRKDDLEKKAVELGAVITDNVREATHLVMSEVQLTFKFICAISQLQFVLSDKWIEDSYEQKKFLGEEPYILSSDMIKELSGTSLTELLSKPNRDKLFQEKQFYVTPGVVPGRRYLHEIIECAGGTIQLRRKSIECTHTSDHDVTSKSYIVCGEGDDHLVESMSECCYEIYRPTTVLAAILSRKMLDKSLLDIKANNKE